MVIIGIMIPLLGTTLGSATVFLMRRELNESLRKLMLGFASGVMIAAGVWSLLIPAIDMAAEQEIPSWFPASVGFLTGVGFLLFLDTIIPHLHAYAQKPEGPKTSLPKSAMLILAVTLHNLPEGMAVGVVFAGALSGEGILSIAAAFSLSLGIALQNVPEGAVISMPLHGEGMEPGKAFTMGMLSGIIEPVGALLTIFLTGLITPALPYILSFAAGAMIYVVVEELIPESHAGEYSNIGVIGAALGFVLMMVLDVALG